MAYDGKRFREMLRNMIGSGYQGDFADKCGISRSHLSRLLSEEYESQPSKSTLRKIAEYSGANYEELLAACGYESTTPAAARKKRSFEDRAKLNARDMAEGFRDMTKAIRLYDSIASFLEDYLMLYSYENCKYTISLAEEYKGKAHPGAENYVTICMQFGEEYGKCYTYAVIYFAETIGGKLVIVDAALDGRSLLDAKTFSEDVLKKAGLDKDEIASRDYVYTIRQTTEQRVMMRLFGDPGYDDVRYPYTIVGFGFEVNEVPQNFEQFVRNHKDTIMADRAAVSCVQKMAFGDDPADAFDGYKDKSTCEEGFQALIANVMKAETQMDFAFYPGEEQEEKNVILVQDGLKDFGLEKMKEVTERYCRELGIKQYGEHIVYTSRYRDNTLQFYILN